MNYITPIPWAGRFKRKVLHQPGRFTAWKFKLIIFVVNVHTACHDQRKVYELHKEMDK